MPNVNLRPLKAGRRKDRLQAGAENFRFSGEAVTLVATFRGRKLTLGISICSVKFLTKI